nr:hypothetical protein [Tanacetum cinerariifolium]
MRMEQYLTHTDYALWEVIINGDSLVPEPPTVGTIVPPKTKAQKFSRKNELKAKSTLLLAIPDEHLLKFHTIKDAKSLWEAIKIRFGGNKESKKMHKTILKKQYENFVASRSEGLDKTYDWFQKLISQLELNSEVILQEDANIKLIKSLPLAWNNIALIMRNKHGIETLSIDNLYNNLKVYEDEIKGQSSLGSNSHNVAFVSFKNTSSINETVNAALDIPAAGSKEQPYTSSYPDDVAMITMRVKKFMKRIGKNLNINSKEPVGFDKTKVECFNCHKRGHFARECCAPMNQGNRGVDNERKVFPIETPTQQIHQILSVSEIDEDNNQEKDRYKVGIGYHAVLPPYTRNYMLTKADLSFIGLDDSVFKFKISETRTSVNENESITSKYSEEIREEPKTVRVDWNGMKTQKQGIGFEFNKRACFLCGSVNHLIKDCIFYENKMVQKYVVNNKGKGTGQREVRPVWNNDKRVNHQNFSKMTHPHLKRNFVPTAVATKSGQVLVNAAKQNSTASTSTARPILLQSDQMHMTGNMSFLTEYQEIDGGFVTFGGSLKRGNIPDKGKIRTGKLDFEDVYFVKELKFNLLSVLKMCEKKHSVLFTKTECLILSPDFKLLDESQVLLKVPRQNNMYSFDLKNVVRPGDLTCLFAKATIDESNL